MKPRIIRLGGICGICCLVLGAAAAAAQDSLTAARDLYASAAYEEALAVLSRLEKTASVATELEDQYRAFSLFALGRTGEAETVAERLVTKNPLLELDGDASPRIVAMFASVRTRLLPVLIREKYRAARASMDRKDFATAEPQLKTVKQMLEESKRLGAADDLSADIGLLVDGFLGLMQNEAASEARIAEAAAKSSQADPVKPAPQTLTRPADAGNAANSPASSSGSVAASGGPASVPPTSGAVIYGLGSPNVIPPVVLRQDAPGFPSQLATTLTPGPKTGTIEILIDEKGNVERAVMRESINPVYDHLLVTDAKKWKYRPAVKDQMPVKFLKMVAISVNIENVTGSAPR